MAYAIVINLDHQKHSNEVCKILWNEIKEAMVAAGFHTEERTFFINLPEKEACQRARDAMDSLESHLEYHRKHLHKYLREFYGFPAESRTNLLLPPVDDIEVAFCNGIKGPRVYRYAL